MKALGDVIGTQRGANRALLDDFHRRSQRAGAQQQRQVTGFGHAHGAGNLETVAEFTLDNRRGQHFALAFFKQQDRHALFEVLAAGVAHNAAALGIDRQIHLGLLVLRIKAGLGIGQVFAGQDDLLFDNHGLAVALEKALGTEGNGTIVVLGGAGFGAVFHQTHFQRGGTAQNVLGLGRVLNAGQLHHDAVDTLLLNHRLGHAQFIDPVVQRHHVLLERLVLDAAGGLRLDGGAQLVIGAVGCFRHLKVWNLVLNEVFSRREGGRIAKPDFDHVAVAGNAAVADVLFTQRQANVTGQRLSALGQRSLHVHLQHEMHAAAQVQPEVHRVGIERGQPGGRARQQVQCHHIRRIGRIW